MRAFKTICTRLLLVFMSVSCGVLKLLDCRHMSCTSVYLVLDTLSSSLSSAVFNGDRCRCLQQFAC